MTHDEIMKSPIENVEETEWKRLGSIFISFDIDGITCRCEAHLSKDNVYVITRIFTGVFASSRPSSKQEKIFCSKLNEHRRTIFERVIQSKPIRLNWLFRAYTFD